MRDASKQPKAYAVKREGKWWARIVYFDSRGRRRELRRLAETVTKVGKTTSTERAAKSLGSRLLAEALATDGRALEHEETTFNQVSDFYERNFLCRIEYDAEGDKLGGRGMRAESQHTPGLRLAGLCR